MRRPGLSVSTRFFLALFVLLASLLAVGGLGLRGMGDVQRANDQLYADNLLSEQATSELGADLDRAQSLTLRIASSASIGETERLNTELDQIVIPNINGDIGRVLRLHRQDRGAEQALIAHIPEAWQAVLVLAGRDGLTTERLSLSASSSRIGARALAASIGGLIAFVTSRRPIELATAADAHNSARHTYNVSQVWLLIAGLVALAAAAAMARVGVKLKRMLDEQKLEERYSESEDEFIDTLQVTESEDEARELVRRQLERTVNDARALVLGRNNSADRLEATTSLEAFEELGEPLAGATPRSCLAVRLGRGHAEVENAEALMACEICGGLPGASTCEPLLVGGEVIGAVLINQVRGPGGRDRQRIRETVAQAAPVLGNLRNLAIAQMRAATDGLTGLPNHRAAQDTLKRMVAQAVRTSSPLAALVVDLDHFKKINDLHGHDRGDEVLASAGLAFRSAVRESDFVARYGGEEFLLLLPSTDKQGAVHVAEAVREAISSMNVAQLEHAVTASVGLAVLPDDASDAVGLFRSADRALYIAKKNGRNRVEVGGDDDRQDVVTPQLVPS